MNYFSIYFSPHLDDVVLSCGGILKKNQKSPQLIVNIFSGEYEGLTKWDLSCGIKNKNPILIRKKENRRALGSINTTSVYFNFFDNVFFKDLKRTKRPLSDSIKIKSEILKILKENISSLKRVFFPLGISHPDHILIAKIGKEVTKELKVTETEVYFYEDFPYLYNNFKWKASYFLNEFSPIYFRIDKEILTKIKMVISYKSQLLPLLKILYPQLEIHRKGAKELRKRMWKEFLLKYHRQLAEESKIRKAKYCERFWLLK